MRWKSWMFLSFKGPLRLSSLTFPEVWSTECDLVLWKEGIEGSEVTDPGPIYNAYPKPLGLNTQQHIKDSEKSCSKEANSPLFNPVFPKLICPQALFHRGSMNSLCIIYWERPTKPKVMQLLTGDPDLLTPHPEFFPLEISNKGMGSQFGKRWGKKLLSRHPNGQCKTKAK